MGDSRIGRKAFQALFTDTSRNKALINDFSSMTERKIFTDWVRDMYRLWRDLTAGSITVLVELFPAMVTKIITSDNDPMLEAIFNQQAEILRKLESGAVVAAPAPIVTTGKSIKIGNISAPIYDDEDTVVINKDANSASNVASNFLSSVTGLVD